MSHTQRILIVEDDQDIAELITHQVRQLGHVPLCCHDLACAEATLAEHKPGLIVLDRMLPDGDGVAWLQHIRSRYPEIVVLVLTAIDDEMARVEGLEGGADDYMGKPFSLKELAARIKALLRRTNMASSAVLSCGQLKLYPEQEKVLWADQPIALTRKEFKLLSVLLQQPDQCVSKQQLLNQVWGTDYAGYEHALNVAINRLRQKLESAGAPRKLIETLWGRGYRLNRALT